VRLFIKRLAAALSDEERVLLRLLAAADRDYNWCRWDSQRPAPVRVLIVFCLAERFWVAAQLTWMLRITAHGREVLAALPAASSAALPKKVLEPQS
jgi:hypothetical protein